VDLRRAPGRLRHRHPLGERHPPAVARGARPVHSRGSTGRDVAGCAERELVGAGVLGLADRAALGSALGPHGPGGAARSVTSRVLQPSWRAVRDPEPVAVFGAEQLRVAVSVAVGLPVGFPVPVPHPLADGFSDPLPLGDRYYVDLPAGYHATGHDPATHDATADDTAGDDTAGYDTTTDDTATHHAAAYDHAADVPAGVLVGAFGAALFGVGALFIVRIVWRVLFGEVRWTTPSGRQCTSEPARYRSNRA
jgi:hypothetical protein